MVIQIKTSLEDLAHSGYYESFVSLNRRAFEARGKQVVPDFFEQLKDWNIAYILLRLKNECLVGSMLGIFQEPDARMRELGLDESYIVLDKIAVAPEEWGNGHLYWLMDTAKAIDFDDKQRKKPTVWRADESVSGVYTKYSDFSDKPAVVNGFYIHGFGFYNVGQSLYKDPRALFEHMAQIVANRPKTVVPINQ